MSTLVRRVMLAAVAAYLLLPLVAVLLYSLATVWRSRILPDGYTLEHYVAVFLDPRIQGAVLRSIALAVLVTLIDLALVIPAAYWSRIRNPRIRPIVEIGAAIPFALPWVVVGFGIDRLVGIYLPSIQSTFPVLVLAQAAIAFPFFYWAIDGAMAAAGIARLVEAAETCGAAAHQTLLRVVLPVIRGGIATGTVLVFAVSFGEFALAQILVGSAFDTLPLWQAQALLRTDGPQNELAVTTVIVFVVLFILATWLVTRGGRGPGGAPEPTASGIPLRTEVPR